MARRNFSFFTQNVSALWTERKDGMSKEYNILVDRSNNIVSTCVTRLYIVNHPKFGYLDFYHNTNKTINMITLSNELLLSM